MFNPKIQSIMNDKIKTNMAIKATHIAYRLMDAAYYFCGAATDTEEHLLVAEEAAKKAIDSLRNELKIADDVDISPNDVWIDSNLSIALQILKDAGDMIDDFKEYIDGIEVTKK